METIGIIEDDYVVKPFPMRVLIKRIQAVLYRCREEKDEFFPLIRFYHKYGI